MDILPREGIVARPTVPHAARYLFRACFVINGLAAALAADEICFAFAFVYHAPFFIVGWFHVLLLLIRGCAFIYSLQFCNTPNRAKIFSGNKRPDIVPRMFPSVAIPILVQCAHAKQ